MSAVAGFVITLACSLPAEARVGLEEALHLQPRLTAVPLAAAAASVPDAIGSAGDARQSQCAATAVDVSSNKSDIAVGFGLPLMPFGLIHGESVTIDPASVEPIAELLALLLL